MSDRVDGARRRFAPPLRVGRHLIDRHGKKPLPRWVRIVLVVAASVIALVLLYSLIESMLLETKQVTFTSPDLPPAFDGVRIVFVSDLHRGPFLSEKRVGEVVNRVNSLNADVVLLGGDYVYRWPTYEESAFRQLSRLQARLGVYAVLGNHDYGDSDKPEDVAVARSVIAGTSIKLLENEGVWLTRDGPVTDAPSVPRIRLGGVRDYRESFPYLDRILSGTRPGDFVLLMSHNPDFATQLPPGQIDLVLSGHTHGGQVTFFGLWAAFLSSEYGQRFRSGVAWNPASPVYVSTGVGTVFPPMRFFDRPDIVLFTLRHGAQAAFSLSS